MPPPLTNHPATAARPMLVLQACVRPDGPVAHMCMLPAAVALLPMTSCACASLFLSFASCDSHGNSIRVGGGFHICTY
uniref:Uncharacterized protein n=1 Tax=Oryza nivara TaxID=4536 RepID=A0A0E0I8G0_ORYNI